MSWWQVLWCALTGRAYVTRAALLSDIQADAAATRLAVNNLIHKVDQLSKDVQVMGAREDAAYAALSEKIDTVKAGWASLVAERDALREALANADADAAARVEAALAEDSEVDAARVEAAASALDGLVAEPQPEPQPEESADQGDEEPQA